jgi:hypothetical protein
MAAVLLAVEGRGVTHHRIEWLLRRGDIWAIFTLWVLRHCGGDAGVMGSVSAQPVRKTAQMAVTRSRSMWPPGQAVNGLELTMPSHKR